MAAGLTARVLAHSPPSLCPGGSPTCKKWELSQPFSLYTEAELRLSFFLLSFWKYSFVRGRVPVCLQQKELE